MRTILFFILSALATIAGATNYYVSSSGNDAAAGTIGAPWQTITKVNTVFSSLSPGDSILFKRGEIFYGAIIISRSGSSGSPIIFAAYGSGSDPVITGFTTLTGWSDQGSGIWRKAVSGKTTMNMVTLNDIPQKVGRHPNTGWNTFESASGYASITDNDLGASPSWNGAQVVIRKNHWVIDRGPITSHSTTVISYTSPTTQAANAGNGYFFQRSLNTLDELGEWYYDGTNLSMEFESGNPSSYSIKATTIDTLVYASSRSYVTFDNITFTGSNVAAFYLASCGNFRITNCQFINNGRDAIKGASATSLTISGCSFTNTLSNGIFLDDNSRSATITSNTLLNTGYIPGMGYDGNDSYQGIYAKGNNTTIRYNTIDTTGYIGIQVTNGDTTTIDKNYVNYYCFVKDDGAGIYTYGANTVKTVSNNIVINGSGAGSGTSDGLNAGNGIYMDDFSTNVVIYRNAVKSNAKFGIYIHNSQNITIQENNVYDNGVQLNFLHDTTYLNPPPIRDITIYKNVFVCSSQSQKLLYFTSTYKDYDQFGTADSNYYIQPYGEDVIATLYYYVGEKEYKDAISPGAWADTNAFYSPYDLPQYDFNSMLSTNKYSNGLFASNITGTSAGWYTGTLAASWDNTNKIDGGSCKLTVSALGSTHNQIFTESTLSGAVYDSCYYLLKFSVLSTYANKSVSIYVRIAASPYTKITPLIYFPVTTTAMTHEVLIKTTADAASAVLSFVFNDADGPVYIDNVFFHQAYATFSDPAKSVHFDYNYSALPITKDLTGWYINMDGEYMTTVTIPAYSSVILLKTPSKHVKNTGKLLRIKGKTVKCM